MEQSDALEIIPISPIINGLMITISYTAVGIAGTSISIIMVLITTWRLISHYSGHSCPSLFCSRSSSSSSTEQQPRIVEGWTLKRGMHEALWISMVADLISYITILCGRKYGGMYLLQTVGRSFFEWWAMSLITISWLQRMAGARAGASERKIIFKIYPALLVCFGITLVVFIIQAGVNLFVNGELNVPIVYMTIAEAVAWGVHGIAAVHGSILRYRRLKNLPQWQSMKRRHRFGIAGNWFIVMGLTAFFFLLRSVVFAFSVIFRWDDNTLMYWICGIWLPTIIPSLLYLYILRRRDRVMSWIEGISDATYLMPSAPPTEAFEAFRNTNWDSVSGTNPYDGDGELGTSTEDDVDEYRFNNKLDQSHSSFIGYLYNSSTDLNSDHDGHRNEENEQQQQHHQPLLSHLSSIVF